MLSNGRHSNEQKYAQSCPLEAYSLVLEAVKDKRSAGYLKPPLGQLCSGRLAVPLRGGFTEEPACVEITSTRGVGLSEVGSKGASGPSICNGL